jgi:hypothetical protein
MVGAGIAHHPAVKSLKIPSCEVHEASKEDRVFGVHAFKNVPHRRQTNPTLGFGFNRTSRVN